MMRPDEMASQAQIERDRNFRGNLKSGAKSVASAVATGLGAGLVSKIAPFLSEHIPVELALKGINKVAPKVGQFLSRGQSMGLDVNEGLSFLKEKFNKKESQNSPKTDRNIVEQYDPELHQYIDQEIKRGRTHIQAGALAQINKKFKKSIDKLTKDHKTPWSGILETVYGSQKQQQAPQPDSPEQGGQGKDALMAILQKLQAARGQQQ